MAISLIGNCETCGHDHTKHKGIDPNKRKKSRCTGLQLNVSATEKLGRSVYGPDRCDCNNFITKTKEKA